MSKIHKAERRAVPGLIGLAGPSGSGKTFSALLLAAGLCPKGKRIGLIDTEKGRGEHYADNPTIKANLPEGYDAYQLEEPYSPDRYFKAIEEFQKAGNYGVVIIDSATHEWDGFGGCQDIAENNKLGGAPNWAMAKKEHKRFMRKALTMPFSVIFCLRAQEKTAIIKEKGKMVFNDLGMQPVQEKNFKFEMLIATMLDPVTKFPVSDGFHKVPDDLQGLFQPGRFITKKDGETLGAWIAGGKKIDGELRALEGEFRTASNEGMAGLKAFWDSLSNLKKKKLEPIKDECKKIALEADRQANESSEDAEPQSRPVERPAVTPNGKADEKVSEPKKTRTEKKAPAKDPEPETKPEVLAADTPAPEAVKPVQKQAPKPKPEPEPEPKPSPQPIPDDVPEPAVANDPGTQNALDIAAAINAEVDEDEDDLSVEEDDIPMEDVPPVDTIPEGPDEEPEEDGDDEEELELL